MGNCCGSRTNADQTASDLTMGVPKKVSTLTNGDVIPQTDTPNQDLNGKFLRNQGTDIIRVNSSSTPLPSKHGCTIIPVGAPKRYHDYQVKSSKAGTPTTPSGSRTVVALYNYGARCNGDMSFNKGDKLEIISDKDNDWWFARHLGNKCEGFVPRNFVALENSFESQDWFFGSITRKEAEKLLLQPQNPRGTFLIRNSEQVPGALSLSVKDRDQNREHHIKHYKIKTLDGGGYYITNKHKFATLEDLVKAYEDNATGLCHRLTLVCPRPKPQTWDLSPETKDRWEIDRKELTFIKKLGSGHFGDVWYGKWQSKVEVAIKTLKRGTMPPQAFLEEARIMKQFRHKQLVALYAVCSLEEPVYLVTEYMCNGSLLDYLRHKEGRFLKFEELIDIAAQIASGMSYLEAKQLIHRDLAARNILVGENNVAKICDFGLARVIEDDEYCPKQGCKFPVKWTAPEAIFYGRFTIKSDVWSYGVLLMELFTYGQVPYPGMQNREVIEQIQKGYRMPKPTSITFPDPLYQVVLNCWEKNCDKRPTFDFLFHYFDDFTISSELPYREVN